MTTRFNDPAALVRHLDEVAATYCGDFGPLENAIGMAVTGRLFGWKALYLLHSKKTVRNYEKILGIRVREAFPEVGPLAKNSVAWRAAGTHSNFWKAVSNEWKHPNLAPERRKTITQ